MTGALTDEQIEILMTSSIVGRLACCQDNMPYVIPITFAYHKPFIYCHSQGGYKIESMRKNPHVCFEIDQIDNLANWRSVMIRGEFQELYQEEADEGMRILRSHLAPLTSSIYSRFIWDQKAKNSFSLYQEREEVVFRINILEMSGRYEKSSS